MHASAVVGEQKGSGDLSEWPRSRTQEARLVRQRELRCQRQYPVPGFQEHARTYAVECETVATLASNNIHICSPNASLGL